MKSLYKTRLIIAGVVMLMTILAFFGIYPLKIMNLQYGALLQRIIVDFSVIAIALFALITVFTLIFGRFYCSMLCPFGILQELTNLIYLKLRPKKLPNIEYIKPKPIKYFISALSLGFLAGGSALLIRYIDPYTMFGSFISRTLYGTIFTIVVLALVFYKNRFFCTSICPVGAFLGILSKFSLFKIHINDNCVQCGMCARYCPSKCIDKENKDVKNENCVKCLKCTSVCPKGAIKYGFKIQKPKFNSLRRKSLISIGVLGIFAGAYAMGVKLSKELYSKIKNVILPPGAKNPQTMANKCLNCNLCINNCPNGILVKADSEFPVVHVDYSKGKHFCHYNCNKCSQACPSGAINKISLEEKQNLRIAMASINESCICCLKCVKICPKGAIEIKDGIAKADGTKCIGCGVCASVCPMGAVGIHTIVKQTEI